MPWTTAVPRLSLPTSRVRPDSGNADLISGRPKSATAVQVGLQRIENSLLLPMRQIIAVANDIGRGSLPLERALNDLPGVIDNLAMGPFGSLTSEAVTLEGLAANLTSNASKTAAMNLAIDKKFNTGEDSLTVWQREQEQRRRRPMRSRLVRPLRLPFHHG